MTKWMLRKIWGLICVAIGGFLMYLHWNKIVPAGWESNDLLLAITTLWAYGGLFISMGFIGGGILYLFEELFEKLIDTLSPQCYEEWDDEEYEDEWM